MEIWKSVIGFEGLYEVSNTGKVKTLKRMSRSPVLKVLEEKILAGGSCKGYPCVILHDGKYRKKFTKHRLVAIHFLDNPNNLPQINHKNGDKYDNRSDNLEWCDAFYNQQHRFKVLKHVSKYKGVPNSACSKVVYQIDVLSLNVISVYKSCSEAMRVLGKSNSTCIATAARKFDENRTAYNFRWSYKLPLPDQNIELNFKDK